MKKQSFLLALGLLLWFLLAVARLEAGREEQGRQQLEEALRRTAVSCYAMEGRYPPSIDHMRQHYGLTYDDGAYIVHYEVYASNLMPDITVMERQP